MTANLTWIINYLSDRQRRMVLQGESSCWLDINVGVPQGSAPKMYNQELPNISYSKHAKHLGATLQQKLKWDKDFDEISIKATKRLDILNAFKLDRNNLEMLYFTFTRSVLEYSNEVFFSNVTKENLDHLDKIQKTAGKIVSRAHHLLIFTPNFHGKIYSFDAKKKMIILCADILHDSTPSYLKHIIPQKQLKKLAKADTTYETTQI